jgi:hypothetical protein
MSVDRSESWRDPRLKQYIQQCWQTYNPSKGADRTDAIKKCFIQALYNTELTAFRPDAIWTVIQNFYYQQRAIPVLKEFVTNLLRSEHPETALDGLDPSEIDTFIESINSVRNGWVRSSGVALEHAYVDIYKSALEASSPPIYLIEKASLARHPVGKLVVNTGRDGIGTAREDDLYLIVVDTNDSIDLFDGTPYIFGVVQVKSSLGDRADQAGPRSRVLMSNGYLSLAFTLDPMEVKRSLRGMMVHPNYIEMANGTPDKEPTWHYLYIARNTELHRISQTSVISRIKDVALRTQPDSFVQDVRRAAQDWLNNGHSIPATWH